MPKQVQPQRSRAPWAWRDPIFRHEFLLFVCPATTLAKWVKEHYRQDLDVDEDAIAYTLYTNGNVVVLWFNSERRASPHEWAAYVSHESEHATRFVLSKAGLPHCAESDEAWAYYLCWVTQEVTTRMKLR